MPMNLQNIRSQFQQSRSVMGTHSTGLRQELKNIWTRSGNLGILSGGTLEPLRQRFQQARSNVKVQRMNMMSRFKGTAAPLGPPPVQRDYTLQPVPPVERTITLT